MGRPGGSRRTAVRRLAPLVGVALLAVTTSNAVGALNRVSMEDEIVLSDSPTLHSVAPRVAVTDDGTVHVVWQEGQVGVDQDEPIILHRHKRPDRPWSEPAEVYWDGVQPSIATNGTAVAIAFVRNPFDRYDSTEVLFKPWDATAQSWPDVPSAIQGGLGVAGSQPDLAFDGQGYLWLTWVSSQDIEQRPYYARVLATSGEVDSAGPIDEREQGAQGPVLAVDPEDNVHAAWSTTYPSGEADLSRWEWPSGGRYWVNRESALYDQVREARSPDITASASAMCLTWHEGNLSRPNEVVLSCDRASGNIWFGNISQSPTSRSLLPSLALDETRGAMVLWFEREPGRLVFGRVLPPASPATAEVTNGTTGMPALAFRGDFAYGAWVESTAQGGSEIRFGRWRVELPTPTPSATASSTATAQPTATRTPTVTATRTEGPSPTATATGTPAPLPHRIHAPYVARTTR